jgi:hypothetical protein
MNPPLYEIVDALYKGAMKITPQFLEDRPIFTAFAYGGTGAFVVTRFAHKALEKVAPEFYQKYMPKIDASMPMIMCAIPIVYAFIDPQGAKEIMSQHPVYTAGITGAAAGTMMGCVQSDIDRDKKAKL